MLTPKNLRFVGFVIAGLVLAAATVWNSQSSTANAGADEVKDVKLTELRKERLIALREVASFGSRLFQNARIQFESLREANRELLEAELEFCETDAQRVQVLETMLTSCKEIEERARALRVGAQGTEMGVFRAKADRLKVEILLHQIKTR